MIAHLDGDFETVDFEQDKCVRIYDNVEYEEYPTHWHNAVELIMPLAETFDAICGNVPIHIGERELLIIPAGTLHRLKAHEGRRMIMLIDSRTLLGNPALTELLPLLSEPVLITSEDRDLLLTLNNSMKDIYILYSEYGELAEVKIFMHFVSMLTRICEYRRGSTVIEDDQRYADKFRGVIRYIESNYMNDITLDDLADKAGYSKYHFSRIFKKYCGTTFITFLNRRRIRAAEALLMSGEQAVTSIAMQVGFSSLTTFNRVFKEIKGSTPSEFRKLYKPFE